MITIELDVDRLVNEAITECGENTDAIDAFVKAAIGGVFEAVLADEAQADD